MVDGGVGSQEEEEEEGEGGEGHCKVVLAIMVKKEKDNRHSRCLLCFARRLVRGGALRPVCVQVCDVVSVKNSTPCKMSGGVCV